MEEDVDILEDFLEYNNFLERADISGDIRELSVYMTKNEFKAIENLIARYKELEEENKKYPIKMNNEQYNKTIDNAQKELKEELERQINAREISEKYIEDNFMTRSEVKEGLDNMQKLVDKYYIPKSKVKEKIEELRNEEYDDITFKYNKIEVNGIIEVVLQELLDEED